MDAVPRFRSRRADARREHDPALSQQASSTKYPTVSRTPKYECVYLNAWETGSETKAAIRKWMTFYNDERPHAALGGKPPALVYWQRNDFNQPDQQVQRVA
ncbi:transposase [Nitratireductor sp. CAU 1489]|uniref:Transposase n=1 Tax=Nitratireductor arenosus TaxID=2682096 RepID=A0A844QH40_9HYPH|nr:transposase [Nitratireductor arenosus]